MMKNKPFTRAYIYIRYVRLPFLCLALCALQHGRAQVMRPQRPVPLAEIVRSDSITFLDRDITNFQLFALLVDKDVTPYPPTYPVVPLPRRINDWERQLPSLNAVGGTGRNFASQGYSAAATMYQAFDLWYHTLEGSYMDFAERALMGGLPAAMLSSPDATERSVCAQAVIDASQYVYATDTAGLFINFYLNTMAHIVGNGMDIMLDQATQTPFGPMMKLRIRCAEGSRSTFKLRLRLPEWNDSLPVIYVNGHEQEYHVEHGYAVIRRTWHPYDELYMTFDVSPHIYTTDGQSMLRCGPIVYCPQDSIPAGSRLTLQRGGEDALSGHPVYALTAIHRTDTLRTEMRPYFESPADKRNPWMQNISLGR